MTKDEALRMIKSAIFGLPEEDAKRLGIFVSQQDERIGDLECLLEVNQRELDESNGYLQHTRILLEAVTKS